MTSEHTTPPVRPRRRKASEETVSAEQARQIVQPNGKHPDRLRRLTRSIEELHAAAKELRLAPMSLEWQVPPDETPDPDKPPVVRALGRPRTHATVRERRHAEYRRRRARELGVDVDQLQTRSWTVHRREAGRCSTR